MSSVPYDKFGLQDEEGRPKKYCKVVAVVLVAILVIVSVVGIGIGLGKYFGSHGKPCERSLSLGRGLKRGLNIITVTEKKVEGEYYGSAGGIYFSVSNVNGSDTDLTITANTGENIIGARHPPDSSMAMLSLDTTHFLFMKEQPDSSFFYSQPFTILEKDSKVMKSMIEKHPTMSEVMSMVDGTNAEENYQYSFEYIIMRPEIELIVEAAQVLGGQHNVTGSDYPSAMQFYLLALALAEARNSMERIQNTALTTPRQKQEQMYTKSQRCSGSIKSYLLGCLTYGVCRDTCPNSDCNVVSQCPYETEDNACFGLCGPECLCWPWLCPDSNPCCIKNVCVGHDRCCSEQGLRSKKCLRGILVYLTGNLVCDGNFEC